MLVHQVEHERVAADEGVPANVVALVHDVVPAARSPGDAHGAEVLHVAFLARGGLVRLLVGEHAVGPLQVRGLLEELRAPAVRVVPGEERMARAAHRRLRDVLAVDDLVGRVQFHLELRVGILVRAEDLAAGPDVEIPGERGRLAESVGLYLVTDGAGHAVFGQRLVERLGERQVRRSRQARGVAGHGCVAAHAQRLDLGSLFRALLDFARHLRAPVRIAERVGHERALPQAER